MPLWKIHHPVGAYTQKDKEAFAQAIGAPYAAAPIPDFYVVVLFEETPAANCYVGGKAHDHFVRIQIDHLARTIPDQIERQWFTKVVDNLISPWVADRGFEWEFTYNEPPADIWSINGHVPPPFHSAAEKRWIEEGIASEYHWWETVDPNGVPGSPGLNR